MPVVYGMRSIRSKQGEERVRIYLLAMFAYLEEMD